MSDPRSLRAGSPIGLSMVALLAVAATVTADPPAGYYDTVDDSSPSALRSTLHAVIDDHQRYPYTSTATDTWDICDASQTDPNNSSKMLDVYKNASYTKYGAGNSYYNREHTWPKSYGFPNDGSTNYPYTDCHHLMNGDSSYNSSRGNKPYNTCGGCTEKTTLFNNGQGGGSGVYPGNSNWTAGSGSTGSWETWIGRRGDVARALMYMDVRYEGGTHGVTGAAEPNLILTDNASLIVSSSSNQSVAYMGMLSVLVQWHYDDPVDDFERDRNDIVAAYQGNRNPFIDHPEWVACLFESDCGAPPPAADPWINELHYDNNGADSNEFVEIAGEAGMDLTGWKLVAYNGSGGGQYATVNMSGTIPNQQNGYGTRSFAISGLQNGAPDGVALIDSGGAVVQFLSYEGSFTATDGPAAGYGSTNIGVVESESTSVGHSLRLSGTGNEYSDFTWQPPAAHTSGNKNTGQTFQ